MGVKIKLSDGAKGERAKLPENVRDDLDEALDGLAGTPGVPGDVGDGVVDGVGPDGSYYNARFIHEFDEAGEIVVIDIDIFSY